jgi:hypothetical protein
MHEYDRCFAIKPVQSTKFHWFCWENGGKDESIVDVVLAEAMGHTNTRIVSLSLPLFFNIIDARLAQRL